MKILKYTTLLIILLLSTCVVSISILYWPIDHRVIGTFKSDKEETFRYIVETKDLPKEKSDYISQLYGYIIYDIQNHRLKITQLEHTFNAPYSDESIYMPHSEEEFFLFMLEKDGDYASFVAIPKSVWNIDEVTVINMPFTNNGFWLDSPESLFHDWKEKFKKI